MGRFRFLQLIVIPLFVFAGCNKDDIDDLKRKNAENEARIAALEQWQKTVNSNITALQALVDAIDTGDYVTEVKEFTTPEPGGYTITFLKGSPITIWNGAKGDTGADGQSGTAPEIGVKQDSDGIYYWTLDGEWITDDGTPSGNKLPVTGAGGTDGKDGTDGSDGKDGATPKVAIGSDGFWYISADGSATGNPPGTGWENTNVKATGNDGAQGEKGDSFFQSVDTDNPDYVVLTLSDGTTTITLPRYKAVGITFEQPKVFEWAFAQEIEYTSTGTTDPNNIRIVDMPQGWSYSVNYDSKKITITPPVDFIINNLESEATILVGVDDQIMGMYALELKVDYSPVAKNEVGALYYMKGEPVGIVYKVKTADQPGLVFALDQERLVWARDELDHGPNNFTDGLANMAAMAAHIEANGKAWSDFPAFEWCDNKNGASGTTTYSSGMTNIWYLPSLAELQYMLCAAAGEPYETWGFPGSDREDLFDNYPTFKDTNTFNLDSLNDAIEIAGGTKFERTTYWSSIQQEKTAFVWSIYFINGFLHGSNKPSPYMVRAILAY